MQAYIVAAVIITVAAACDYFTKKIPNLIIVAGYVIGFITMILLNGWEGCYIYFIRALWPVLALFILYFLKALGAGDIKLFSVVSIFCPTEFLIRLIICSLLVAALQGVAKLLIHKELQLKMSELVSHIRLCISTGEVSHYTPTSESSYICFSVCMLIAYGLCIGWEVLL